MPDGNHKKRGWLELVGRHRAPTLGERELAVLEVLWSRGASSAKDVRAAMEGRRVSLSTAQSTLERLTRKGLLSRSKQGRSYLYAATVSRSELITRLLRELASDLAGGDPAPMLAGFVDYVSDALPELGPGVSRALRLSDPDPEQDDD